MGGGRYDDDDWSRYASTSGHTTKTVDEVINKVAADNEFLPTSFKGGIRESRDSADNLNSTPIIVAGDVTGSLGALAGALIKGGLSGFVREVYGRKPVPDPHVMGMAIGDVTCDQVPIQCTQFEADIRIIQQFERLYVEGHGGGNDSESYHVPWVVAALMTRTDSWEKRGKRGILFTYGDECVPPPLTKAQAKKFLGITLEADLSAQAALALVSRTWDVYHLIIEEGAHARAYREDVMNSWTALLGQRAIPVSDSTRLAAIMVSILQVERAGTAKAKVAGSWSGTTSLVVARAIDGLTVGSNAATEVVRL